MSQRVLLIDDGEHIRRMLRLTLEVAGYEVGAAADGA
jgi:CheY-like chemotaxis protein